MFSTFNTSFTSHSNPFQSFPISIPYPQCGPQTNLRPRANRSADLPGWVMNPLRFIKFSTAQWWLRKGVLSKHDYMYIYIHIFWRCGLTRDVRSEKWCLDKTTLEATYNSWDQGNWSKLRSEKLLRTACNEPTLGLKGPSGGPTLKIHFILVLSGNHWWSTRNLLSILLEAILSNGI